MGHSIELKAADGHALQAWVGLPAGAPRAGLVVVQEIFGVNSHIRAVVEGYAASGYLVIAPAIFDRVERGVDLGYGPDDMTRGRALKAAVGNDAPLLDIAAARNWLAGQGLARVGVLGYCFGGLLTWLAAARVPGFSAAVPYYGGGMPEFASEQPQCPVMAHFGERDHFIPMESVNRFKAAQPAVQVHVYAADHGFNCDQRGSYDADAARLARDRTLSFLAQHLG